MRMEYFPGFRSGNVAGLSSCLLSSIIVAPVGDVLIIARPNAGVGGGGVGTLTGAGGSGATATVCDGADVDLAGDAFCMFWKRNHHPKASTASAAAAAA